MGEDMTPRARTVLAVGFTACLLSGTAAEAARSSRVRRVKAAEPPPEEEEAREEARERPEKPAKRKRGRDTALEAFDAGLAAYRRGDFAAALASLGEAVDADDSYMPALSLRAQVRGALGDAEGMRRDLSRPLKNSRSEPAFRRARAEARVLAGLPAEALKDYDWVVEKDPDDVEAMLGRGRARRILGDTAGARADFIQALKDKPDHLVARVHLARIFADSDRPPLAVKELTRALNGNRDFAMAYEVLAAVLAGQGDDRAFSAWSRAIQLAPENPRARVGRALMYLKKGNKTLAEKDFLEAVRLAPDDFSPLFHRGESRCRLGDAEGCAEDLNAVLKLAVPDSPAAVLMGDRLAELKLPKESVEMYGKAVSAALADPGASAKADASLALRRRAAAREELGDARGALSDLSGAVSAAPEDAEPLLARAALYVRVKEPRKALGDYDKALSLKEDLASALLGRAELLAAAGKVEEAVKDLDAALASDPRLAAAYDRRGRLKEAAGRPDEALKDYMKAVELEPGQADFLLDLGVARLRGREYWKAIAALDRSLAQGGPAAEARGARAEARAALGMVKQALDDLDEALKADPKSSDLHALLGHVQVRMRLYPEALRALDRAVALDRKNARAYRSRGHAHAGLGELAEAVDDFNRAAALTPRPVEELTDLCHAERLRGRDSRAVDACSKALQLDPDAGWTYVQRGLAYLAGGDASRAARDLDDGTRLEAPRASALLARSIAHAALRQYKESDRAYREAMGVDYMAKSADITLGEDPGPAWDYRARVDALAPSIDKDADDPYSYLVRGNALHNAGLFDQAILEYTRALETDGRMTAAYLARGSALSAQDSLDAAEQDFRRAVSLSPKDPLTHLSLVTLLTARRKYADGLKAAIAALKAQEDSPYAESFVKAGNLRYFVRELDRAQENFSYALKFAPNHASAHNGLGLCHFAKKRYEKALESFSRAVDLMPDHERYYRNRASTFVNMGQFENAVSDYKLALAINKDPLMVEEYQRLIDAAQARVGQQASSGR
jgi:tetratricopeptide (TPR) repeat protein